jgi:hypothetical protein
MMTKHTFKMSLVTGLALILGLALVGLPGGVSAQEPEDGIEAQAALGTAFTYQGRLSDAGGPVNSTCNFTFDLYDAAGGGTSLGTDTASGGPVSDGYFGVGLDYGAGVFGGQARWLEISLDCGSGATTLSPRQPLTAAPYALYALGAPWSGLTGVPAGLDDGDDDTTYSAGAGLSLAGTTFSADTAYLQRRVSGTCASGNAIRVVNANGSVVCQSVSGGVSDHGALSGLGDDDHTQYFHRSQDEEVTGRPTFRSGVIAYGGGDGVNVRDAGDDGVQVSQPEDDGLYVYSAGGDGVQVDYASGYGVHVRGQGPNSTGVFVDSVGRYGVYVDSPGWYGVFVRNAGATGVRVEGTPHGVSAQGVEYTALAGNTLDPGGQWGLWTPDKISASNVTASAWTLVAQVDGPGALTAGDLAAVSGVADPLPDGPTPLPQVRLADGRTWNGVIGVVESRMALEPSPGREEEEEDTLVLHSVSGPAQAGDYVALTVLGVAQVKVDASAVDIAPGGRLTAADLAGHARGLRTESLNGMPVTEGAPVIGIALAAPTAESDTIPVFVTLR